MYAVIRDDQRFRRRFKTRPARHLDKLRQVDNAAVTTMQAKTTKAKAQLVAFDDVNAKFVAVKNTCAVALARE